MNIRVDGWGVLGEEGIEEGKPKVRLMNSPVCTSHLQTEKSLRWEEKL